MENRKNPKRLIIDISEEMHAEIKARAARRCISMKVWVERAIIKRIQEEDKAK